MAVAKAKTTTKINGNDIHTILPKCVPVLDIMTRKHYRKGIYSLQSSTISHYSNISNTTTHIYCNLPLELIENQREGETGKFED
jgi:hypothetical protein